MRRESQQSERRVVELPVSPDVNAYFYAILHQCDIKIEGFGGIKVTVPQYWKRLDENQWPIKVVGNNCLHEPPQFHACLYTVSRMLRHVGKEKMVYEGDADPTVNIRQILQSCAKLYQVDPNEIASVYPTARVWLGHKAAASPLPRTLDEFENRLKLAGDTKLGK